MMQQPMMQQSMMQQPMMQQPGAPAAEFDYSNMYAAVTPAAGVHMQHVSMGVDAASLESAKYNKAMELVNLFGSEPDALGAVLDYLEAIHMTSGGSRKRPRMEEQQMPAYGGYPMATIAGAPSYMMAPQMMPQAKTRGGAPVEGVDGNWRCPGCSNINFGMRDNCNSCKSDKPADVDLAAPPAFRVNPVAGVDGNWECTLCAVVNFANRENCFKCKAGKDGTPGTEDNSQPKGGAPREGDNGNWRCSGCSNINFAIRTHCNRCKMGKPMQMGYGAAMPMMAMPAMPMGTYMQDMSGMGGGMAARPKGGAPQEGVDGNWKCDCGNVNFKFR